MNLWIFSPRMRIHIARCFLCLALLVLASCERKHNQAIALDVAPFGRVMLYRHNSTAKHIVFLLSDEKGWRPELEDRAWAAAWPDRVVVAIDLPHFLQGLGRTECIDYAGPLAKLKSAVAAKLKVPVDQTPFFSGLGAGGAVIYAAAVETPGAAVQSVVADGFCPILRSPSPPCAGSGDLQSKSVGDNTFELLPSAALKSPLVAIARPDQCTAVNLQAFMHALPDGRLVEPVPHQAVDLFASVATQTMAQSSVGPPTAADIAGIPVVEVQAAPGSDDRLAIVLSGDGGWADIDKDLGEMLAKRGIAVVGFNSLKYFWNKKTLDQTSADFERMIQHYLKVTGRERLVFIGYSFGANVLPLLYERLSDELKARTTLVALLATGPNASFEIAVGGWVGVDQTDGPDVAPVLKALDVPILCVHSAEATDDPCPSVSNPHIEVMTLPGDHHFNHAYSPIAERIIAKSNERR